MPLPPARHYLAVMLRFARDVPGISYHVTQQSPPPVAAAVVALPLLWLSMDITLMPEHKKLIGRKLARGQCDTASDVARDALYLLAAHDIGREARLAALRAEIQKGMDGGPPIPPDEAFRKLHARIAARRNGKTIGGAP